MTADPETVTRALAEHAPVIWTPRFADGRIVACECEGPMGAEGGDAT